MNLDFRPILDDLGPDFGFKIANETRPASRYAFSRILPERTRPDYSVSSGDMTIRPTMAGLVGMDSPYPPGGHVSVSSFLENTAKVANSIPITEAALRELQALLSAIRGGAQGSEKEMLVQTVLNFTQKVVVQSHWDTFEWLRAQALLTGEIDWTFNGINLLVDYGVPEDNLLNTRTGNDRYGESDSKFWEDHRTAQSLLKYQVASIWTHPETLDVILGNAANNAEIIAQSDTQFTIRRAPGGQASSDTRDRITVNLYAEQGAVLNTSDASALPVDVDFMPVGKLLYVGRNQTSGFRVGEGVTDSPANTDELGYTHIGPTVEGGRPGRWVRTYTPEAKPWMLVGEGVTNGLPVIEAPQKLVVLSTEV